ncbi:MAG: chromate transporter [Oscillospiraceae bacterium]|nr:chromate transporter [Oscillospiraceae bacterium]
MILLRLYWEFFKVGLFAVGGGLATLPFLYSMGETTGWFGTADVADMLAVSESTPGPIGVNMATYVGFGQMGLPGALVATLGLVTPCFLIILAIAAALHSFRNNKYVDAAFSTLRPASTGLIAAAGWSVFILVLTNVQAFRESGELLRLFRWGSVGLFILLWVLTNLVKPLKKLHPVVFLALAAVAGIVFHMDGA